MTKELSEKLISGGYVPETPAAIVYKATWPDEKVILCTVGTLDSAAKENNITKTAIILIGDAISHSAYEKSKLYSADFETEYRAKKQ